MNLYDLCSRETVKIRMSDHGGRNAYVVSKPAWKYGDFAVHERVTKDGWGITHLPTGTQLGSVGCVFPSADEAVAAMIEIQKLRNDWIVIDAQSACEINGLREQIAEIAQRFGGKTAYSGWGPHKADLVEVRS